MDDQYRKMKEGAFREHMLEMSRWGGKTEAIRIIQSRIESILTGELTGNSRREFNKLNYLLMDIASNKGFENDDRYSSNLVLDRMLQSNEHSIAPNERVKRCAPILRIEPSTSKSPKYLSNFLSSLKDSLELVNRIGKKQALEQLHLQIDEMKKNGGKSSNQKIKQLKKVIDIITREKNLKTELRRKKTEASNEQPQNLGTKRKKKTKTSQKQKNLLTKRKNGTESSNHPTQEQNTPKKKKKKINIHKFPMKKEILPKKKREKKLRSNVLEIKSENNTVSTHPVKKERTEGFSNVRVKQEVIEID